MLLRIKELEFLDFGDLRVTVSRAKNFESFNAKASVIEAYPGGKVNTVGFVAQFARDEERWPEDLLSSCFKDHKGKVA